MRTYMANEQGIEREWHLIDADDKVVGRLATRIAMILMGKHKPTYTPHCDTGDNVVVVNCEKVRFTGRKMEQQTYYHHTGWVGGLRARPVREVLESKPADVIYLAVRRMLPKTRLGKQMIRKLKIYAGPEHPHVAQNPQPLTV
jgi:large subunit ribosomal protein L13